MMLSCFRSGQLQDEGAEMDNIQASGLPNAMNLVRLHHHHPPHDCNHL